MSKKKFRTGADVVVEMNQESMKALGEFAFQQYANSLKSGNGLNRAKFKALVKKGLELMEEEKNGHICSPNRKKRPRKRYTR